MSPATPAAPAVSPLSTLLTVATFALGAGLLVAGVVMHQSEAVVVGAGMVTAKAISYHWGSVALAKLPAIETAVEDVEQYGPALLKFLPPNLQPIAKGLLDAGVEAETVIKALQAAQGAPATPVATAAAAGVAAAGTPAATL